jgi:hypothetical protein
MSVSKSERVKFCLFVAKLFYGLAHPDYYGMRKNEREIQSS